jgi:hypothetical protein
MSKSLTFEQASKRKCVRCGLPGHATWDICTDGNKPRVLCVHCDYELNALVMAWARIDKAKQKLSRYARKLKRQMENK